MVDGLFDGLCNGAHCDDDVFCIRCAIVVERTVVSSGEFADFTHIAGNDIRNCVIVLVACLASLKVNVAVLCRTAGNRCIRAESPLSESGERLGADHVPEGILVDKLDLLDFMRCTESVEEMQERYA